MSAVLNNFIKSPLNFTGGKHKLLPQIFPLLPNEINNFVDIFCGGMNVAVNTHAKLITANDRVPQLIELYEYLIKHNIHEIEDQIYFYIKKYKLSETSKHGYAKYKTDSSRGVSEFNKEKYLKLRAFYNKSKIKDPMLFFTLIIFAFNNQIRFNSNGEFNLPVNKRDFTSRMQNNLRKFVLKLQSIKVDFYCKDFSEVAFDKSSFVYLDPPYLITNAAYNENKGWTIKDEERLLVFIDEISGNGNKFALSNVFKNKGKTNDLLSKWSKKYNVHFLKNSYSNSNYQSKNKKKITSEVLITNY